MFYGPERDLKNFPILKQQDLPPPTKLGFIPQSWFNAFYEKTGVTGEAIIQSSGLKNMLQTMHIV